MADGEKGWQLSVGISRLKILKMFVQKMSLSATVGNPHLVAKWLSSAEPINAVIRTTELFVDAMIQTPEDGGFSGTCYTPRAHATLRGLADIVSKKSPCCFLKF